MSVRLRSACALVLAAAASIACSGEHPLRPHAPMVRYGIDVLVVAPHPDDETLIAAGVVHDAVAAGKKVAVVVVTNGDFTCASDGFARERETIAATRSLGLHEADVHFLGYPDGHLAELGDAPLPPVERRAADGTCVRANTTYAAHGAFGVDEHTHRTGAPARYTANALTGDLAALLRELRPRDVYVTHGIDAHPDHAATYVHLRRAIEAVGFAPEAVHRAIVHAGPCWPNGRGLTEPCPGAPFAPATAMPPLPDPLAAYVPTERRVVPAVAADPAKNLKMRAIASYPTQTGPSPTTDWLASFARREEPFWVERLEPTTSGAFVRANHGSAGPSCGPYGVSVRKDGPRPQVVITRGELVLRRIALPHDAASDAQGLALAIDARPDEHAVELTVRRAGAFFGVAIDAAPQPACLATPRAR